MENVWVVVLAGGDGARMAALTGGVTGEAVPKQYDRFGLDEPMVRWAIERALGLTPLERIVVVVAEQHRRFWARELRDLPPANVIVQPSNRGTAPGVLLPLLDVFFRSQRNAEVVVLPSDHHVADETVLREALLAALRETREPDRPVVLLGMPAAEPEADLGWILPLRGPERVRVAAFVEKPDAETARYLHDRGALVNSFMLAAHSSRLLSLYAAMQPRLLSAFVPVVLNGSDRHALRALYDEIPSSDFCRDVLEGCPGALAVQSVRPCGWTDLSTTARVERLVAHLEAELEAPSLHDLESHHASVYA